MSPLLSTENHNIFGANVFAVIRRLVNIRTQPVAVVCVALLLSAPFVLPVNGLPVSTFNQEWTAVSLGCAAFLAILFIQTKTGLNVPHATLLPLGLLLLLLIQMVQGRLIYWQQGVIGAMYLVWSVAMLCAGSALRQRLGWDGFCKLVARAICIGALLSAVIAVFQLIGWQMGGLVVPMIGLRAHANLGQANHFANYLCLGLIATIYLACTRSLNVFAAGGASVFLLALANFSGSRSVWLYLAAVVLLGVWAHRGVRSNQTRALVLWVATAIATLLVLQLISIRLSEDSTLRQATAVARISSTETSPSHRSIIWSTSMLMLKSAPLSGVGFGGFAWNHFLLAGPLPTGMPEEITDNAHNIVLQFLAEFGLTGGLMLIGAAFVWWVPQFREKASFHRWLILSLVAIISLHSLLEYPLWYAYFLGPFALFVGAADNSVWHVRPIYSSRIIVVALCIGIVWTLASVYYDYRRVERLGYVIESGSLKTDVRRSAVSVARSSLFTHVVELGLSRTISVDRNELDAKIELNGRVLRTYPDADVVYRQSALLALAGDLAAAYRFWDLAVAAFPSRATEVANSLAQGSSMGEARLVPLVEYAASRNKE